MQIDVVDADHFASVDVDNLLVEQIALEEEKIFQSRGHGPLGSRYGSTHLHPRTDLNHARKKKAVAFCGLDYQTRDAIGVFLRPQSHFAHFSDHCATGVSNACPKQSRKGQRMIHQGRIPQNCERIFV
jgi:hypothetical protein